jgi:hypothetical protein
VTWVLKKGDEITPVIGNPTLTSLDGEARGTFRAITRPGWPVDHAVSFGLFDVDTAPDGGQRWDGRYALDAEGVPVAVFESVPDKYPDLQSARVAMVGYIDTLTKQITDDYPASEVASWGSKAEAARAVEAGTARADQTAMIQNEADITGRTLAAQAAAVIAKAALFEEVISKASGLRQATDITLVAAATSAQRETILQSAMAQAQSLAEPFGL